MDNAMSNDNEGQQENVQAGSSPAVGGCAAAAEFIERLAHEHMESGDTQFEEGRQEGALQCWAQAKALREAAQKLRAAA